MTGPMSRSHDRLVFGAFFCVTLFVYLHHACRALAVMGDSAELVAAAAVGGVPHPPGYPLYTLVAHVFTRLPWLELPARVHATSAIFHAAAATIVGCTIRRVTGSVGAAAIGAGTLALGRVFFVGSLYAEVFPLNDLLFAWLLWFATRIALPKEDAAPSVGTWAAAFLLGLALAHHPMIVLAFPALAVLVGPPLVRLVRAKPWCGPAVAAFALLPPLGAYALVPWAASRDPHVSWGDVHDLGSLVHLVTRQDYGGPLRASRRLAEGQLLERLDVLAVSTYESFGFAGTLLAAAGALAVFRRDRRVALGLALAAFVPGPVFAAANAFDIHSEYRVAFFERFVSMCHVPIAVLVGVGAASAATWLRTRARLGSRSFEGYVPAAMAAIAIGPLLPNLARLDMSEDRLGIVYAHDLVLSTPDDSLVLLKGDMPSQAALYVCGVEQRCGDRIVFAPGQLHMPWKRAQLARRNPGLSLPVDGEAPATLRRLVGQELARRPVFVDPGLLDDALAHGQAALPAGLLFRIYASEQAARDDLPRFRAELSAIALGERCHGCFEARRRVTSLTEQLMRAYETAIRTHVDAARELGLDGEAEALRARAHL